MKISYLSEDIILHISYFLDIVSFIIFEKAINYENKKYKLKNFYFQSKTKINSINNISNFLQKRIHYRNSKKYLKTDFFFLKNRYFLDKIILLEFFFKGRYYKNEIYIENQSHLPMHDCSICGKRYPSIFCLLVCKNHCNCNSCCDRLLSWSRFDFFERLLLTNSKNLITSS